MKKLTRFLAIILSAALIFSLAACGSASTDDTSSAADASADDTSEDTAEVEAVEISIANYDTENSFTVQCIEAFIEYVEEASGGAITFKTYYGATLCSMSEEYEYLKSGSVDMIATIPTFCMSEIPYVYAVNNVVDDQDIIDYTNWLWFENEETASIIDTYCTQYGVVLLGAVDAGTSIICSTYEAESYDDMTSGKIGCARDYDVYDALGLNPVNLDTTESYDSLSRGVCDSLSYTPSSYYTAAIYEVAPYCLSLNVYGNSNTYMFNLDSWNSLSEEQQQILRDGMAAAQEFSVEGNIESIEQAQSVADAWHELSDDEALTTCQLMEEAVSVLLLESADALGTTEDMLTILQAKEEYTGIENIPDEYR